MYIVVVNRVVFRAAVDLDRVSESSLTVIFKILNSSADPAYLTVADNEILWGSRTHTVGSTVAYAEIIKCYTGSAVYYITACGYLNRIKYVAGITAFTVEVHGLLIPVVVISKVMVKVKSVLECLYREFPGFKSVWYYRIVTDLYGHILLLILKHTHTVCFTVIEYDITNVLFLVYLGVEGINIGNACSCPLRSIVCLYRAENTRLCALSVCGICYTWGCCELFMPLVTALKEDNVANSFYCLFGALTVVAVITGIWYVINRTALAECPFALGFKDLILTSFKLRVKLCNELVCCKLKIESIVISFCPDLVSVFTQSYVMLDRCFDNVGECPVCACNIGKANVGSLWHTLKCRCSAEGCADNLYYLCSCDRSVGLEGAVRVTAYKTCGCRRLDDSISCVSCGNVCKAYSLIGRLYLAHIVYELNKFSSCYRLIGLEATAVALEIAEAFNVCYVIVVPCARLYICKWCGILTLDGSFINEQTCDNGYSFCACHLTFRLEYTSVIACDKGCICTLWGRKICWSSYILSGICFSRFLCLEECKRPPCDRVVFGNGSLKREEAEVTCIRTGAGS